MSELDRAAPTGCSRCAERGGRAFTQPFTMAFQPIFDIEARRIFAHEALLRGMDGESAAEIFARVTRDNRYSFDQACRTRAISRAAELGCAESISINFMPNAVYDPAHCLQKTLQAADRHDFPIENIIFEFIESEDISSTAHLRAIVDEYRKRGFRTAIDDFGAGFTGVNLLIDLQPDLIKLDRHLICGADRDPRRRAVIRGVTAICADLGIAVIAEGIETAGELRALQDLGITLMQGHLLARPQLGRLARGDDVAARLDLARPA